MNLKVEAAILDFTSAGLFMMLNYKNNVSSGGQANRQKRILRIGKPEGRQAALLPVLTAGVSSPQIP
ncbi:MAG TPA: hypothetical protein GX509_00225 [Firmicutes bacterium]|nr:hypothetical protein [Bacillota bacterium]HHY97146.1 hypothetical protein [Bacillota bacterium]